MNEAQLPFSFVQALRQIPWIALRKPGGFICRHCGAGVAVWGLATGEYMEVMDSVPTPWATEYDPVLHECLGVLVTNLGTRVTNKTGS